MALTADRKDDENHARFLKVIKSSFLKILSISCRNQREISNMAPAKNDSFFLPFFQVITSSMKNITRKHVIELSSTLLPLEEAKNLRRSSFLSSLNICHPRSKMARWCLEQYYSATKASILQLLNLISTLLQIPIRQ